MKKLDTTWIPVLAAVLLLGYQPVSAQDEASARAQEEVELQAAYEDALRAAEQEREAAEESIERARIEMQQATEERVRASAEMEQARESHHEAESLAHMEHEVEYAAMREELSRAHEELRRASREVARVHRELEHPSGMLATTKLVNLGDRAVIGVILGESNETGVHVLGVSPDGPAERAGIEQGDVIVSVMGETLAVVDEEPARNVLHDVLEGVEVGDELAVTVARGDDTLDYTVVAERREPFAWHSMVRLPSVPAEPGAPIIVERIEIPEIDTVALAEQMERIREDLDHTRIVLEARRIEGLPEAPESPESPETWELEFESLSDIGEEAMLGANVWFGMSMTRGLRLAEVDVGLGEYFKTDRGVLVLKAREGNDLQLQSGDVILEVDGTEVNKPSDVMRALRDLEPGSEFEINVMRDHDDRAIEIVVPERRLGFDYPFEFEHEHHFNFTTEED